MMTSRRARLESEPHVFVKLERWDMPYISAILDPSWEG